MTKFTVLGERCSGTNLIEAAITSSTNARVTYPLGYKHFPRYDSLVSKIPIIIVVRDPVDWTQSLFAKPWHAAPEIRRLTYPEFIRTQWYSIWNEESNTPRSDLRFGTEMQIDQNPNTNGRFENILEMRNVKTAHFLRVSEANPTSVVIRLEDFRSNQKEAIRGICDSLKLPLKNPVSVNGYKGRVSGKRKLAEWAGLGRFLGPPETRRHVPQLEPCDRDYIWSQLDINQEAILGYKPNQTESKSL